MKKLLLFFLLLFFKLDLAFAHVGNSNITLEGMAGRYHVLINIKPPDVIPGTAQLTLYTSNDPRIKITATPIFFYSGKDGAPLPDKLTPVSGQPGKYEGSLWLMNNGSASIQLEFNGPEGYGEMLVPVVAVTTTTQKMPASTAYILLGLGIFLFVFMLTIVSSSVSDGITKAGEKLSPKIKRTKAIAFLITGLLCSVFVYGGYSWWRNVAKKASQYIFKPMHAHYTIDYKNGTNVLDFTVDTNGAQRSQWLPYVIPDHGKIMHMFLISLPGMQALAHIHPHRTGPVNFSVDVPDLPDGKYLALADLVYNSGYTETLKDTVTLKRSQPNKNADSALFDNDDAIDISNPIAFSKSSAIKNETIGGKTGEVWATKDSMKIMLEKPTNNEKHYFTGELEQFHFSLWDKNDQPIVPDLYMGMGGHLMIVRDDGNVFSHVHPVGTYSMAAQKMLKNRMGIADSRVADPNAVAFRDSVDLFIKKLKALPEQQREDFLMMEMMGVKMINTSGSGLSCGVPTKDQAMMMDMHKPNTNVVSFPYTFQSPGNYRIWVQMKKDGKVYTGVFDRVVK